MMDTEVIKTTQCLNWVVENKNRIPQSDMLQSGYVWQESGFVES